MVDKIVIENLSLQYADGVESLRNVSLNVRENAVTVLFGPAAKISSTPKRMLSHCAAKWAWSLPAPLFCL
jgi:ABC-type phosphate transport system ATPase subunit